MTLTTASQFERRIVTDGSIFRIEIRPAGSTHDDIWTPYPTEYATAEDARAAKAEYDRLEAKVWAVVE